MYFLALDCYHWDKRDNGVMYPEGSPNIKGGVPVRNFNDKPQKITAKFSSTTFRPLKISCFESTSQTQKRGKIIENKVRELLKCLCA